jgi:membrane associated rhomboid family serine protease
VSTRAPLGGGFGSGPFAAPPPRDIVVLLAVVFVTFTLRFFATTAILPALLSLTPAVWHAGYLWQLVTYPFVGFGGPDLWFLLELLVLYWFGSDVWRRLGRRRFWRLIAVSSIAAGVAAVLVAIAAERMAPGVAGVPFVLMQGQRTLLVILVAAFATTARGAVILLFFVLPVRAGWLLWLTVAFGFVGFLATRDLAGFAGLVAATATTWARLVPGGPGRGVRTRWLELRQRVLRHRLDRLRRRRGLRVVRDDQGPGPTIH